MAILMISSLLNHNLNILQVPKYIIIHFFLHRFSINYKCPNISQTETDRFCSVQLSFGYV